MDDDIDATELLHHGARDSRAAFDSGDIRSHEEVVRHESVRRLPRGYEHCGADFAQPGRHGRSDTLGAAGNERPAAREFVGVASRRHEGPPSGSLSQTSFAAILRKWQEPTK